MVQRKIFNLSEKRNVLFDNTGPKLPHTEAQFSFTWFTEYLLRDAENIICLLFLQVTARHHYLVLTVYFCRICANRPFKTGTISKRKR